MESLESKLETVQPLDKHNLSNSGKQHYRNGIPRWKKTTLALTALFYLLTPSSFNIRQPYSQKSSGIEYPRIDGAIQFLRTQ